MKELYKWYIKYINDKWLKNKVIEIKDNTKWKISKKWKKYAKYDNWLNLILLFENDYVMIQEREKYMKEKWDLSF